MESAKGNLPQTKEIDHESKLGLKREISLETVQQLLSQKEFVKRMLGRSPEFLEIVTKEVKDRIKNELQGQSK